ncbi:MAG: hypothetical protein MZU95_10305 [Desulfomicrobium escambiense]|nr:hypothetical protein [Desulfomicrobium escambiense]
MFGLAFAFSGGDDTLYKVGVVGRPDASACACSGWNRCRSIAYGRRRRRPPEAGTAPNRFRCRLPTRRHSRSTRNRTRDDFCGRCSSPSKSLKQAREPAVRRPDVLRVCRQRPRDALR